MRNRGKRLFTKLSAVTVLVNFLCYAVLAVVLYRRLDTQAAQQTSRFVLDACAQASGSVATFVARYESSADILSADSTVNEFCNAELEAGQLSYPRFLQYKTIGARFSQMLSMDPVLLSIQLIKDDVNLLSDGLYVQRADPTFASILSRRVSANNQWCSINGALYLLNTPRMSKNSLLVMRISEESLYRSLGAQGMGYDYYLVDEAGTVLSSSKREQTGEELSSFLAEFIQNEGETETRGNIMYSAQQIGRMHLLMTYDISGLSAENRRTVVSMLICVLASMCASILLLTVLSRPFSRNIGRILKKLRVMGEGQYVQRPTVLTGDELQQIDESVCALGEGVDRLKKDLLDAAQHQKALELRFLQMQINRHFLYNSLSSMRWMAVRSGAEELAELMENLIAFYRAALSREDMLLLREEIALVENYVRLENVIHLGEIRFHCDIPENMLEAQVCKMTLQPFIENSIHHGKIQGKTLDIWLTGEVIEDGMLLRVEDNGHGISYDRMEALQAILRGADAGGDSIAIYNTLSRLRGVYGEDVDIAIMTGQGTIVEIMLPLRRKTPNLPVLKEEGNDAAEL